MSILIKGMEMPKDGEAVVLVISNENGKMLAEVDEYCGAVYECVPVPPFEKAQGTMAQHGQEYSCSFMSSSQEISTEWYCVEDMVENAPTIIPADEEGAT